MGASTSLADHGARVTDILSQIEAARVAEDRLNHEARRIMVEITHQRTQAEALRKRLQFAVDEASAAAGLT